jgi:hypothetical protein
MSRAFVKDDDAAPEPRHRFRLPPAGDPSFPMAAARALLQGAHEGDSATAEAATGFGFGDPRLVNEVRQLLLEAREEHNDRMEQLAERYLRRAGEETE